VNRSYRRILVTGASGGGFGLRRACLDRPRETRHQLSCAVRRLQAEGISSSLEPIQELVE
jgi:hypothetical protein